MNDNDITKALECCRIGGDKCRFDCPYINAGTKNCVDDLLEDAINLINRQKAEIERLKVGEYRNISKTISNARIEGIEDFAKRLKDEIDIPKEIDGAVIDFVIDIIDICVQDMTKEDEHD